MIRTRTRKILRDIASRKTRSLLVSISIFVGVFGTIMLFSMRDLLVRQLESDLDQDKLAMVRISLAPNPENTINNQELLATLQQQPGITTVEGQAVYPAAWRSEDGAEFESAFIFAYSEPLDSIQLEPPGLMRGQLPQPGQNEIAIERRFAAKHDLGIGDELTLRILSNTNSENQPVETWTIVGIVFFPYGYQGLNDVMPEDSVFATYADAQHITGFAGFSSIYARYTDFGAAEQSADALTNTIVDEGSYVPILTYTEDPADHSRVRFARTIGNVMASLALLALFVSGFLVWNVISALVTVQARQVGIMKSLGATRFDIVIIYCGIALSYGILGIIPGVALGIPAGFFAAQGLATTANSLIDEFDYSIRAITLGIVSGIFIPLVAAFLPAWRSARIQILDAITDQGISSRYGGGLLTKLVEHIPVPITIRQGISNVLCKKGRMALTGAAIAVAVGAFMGVLAAFTAVNAYLDDAFATYDYEFGIASSDSADLATIRDLIDANFDQLTIKGPAVDVAVEIDGFDKEYDPATGPPALFASGYDPASQPFSLDMWEGHPLEPRSEEVVISRPVAEAMNKQVGDVLAIRAGGHSGKY